MGKSNPRHHGSASRKSLVRKNSSHSLGSAKSAKISKQTSRSRVSLGSLGSRGEASRGKKTADDSKNKRYIINRDGDLLVHTGNKKMSLIKRPSTACKQENAAVEALLNLVKGKKDRNANADHGVRGGRIKDAGPSSSPHQADASKGHGVTRDAGSSSKQGGCGSGSGKEGSSSKQGDGGGGSGEAGSSSKQAGGSSGSGEAGSSSKQAGGSSGAGKGGSSSKQAGGNGGSQRAGSSSKKGDVVSQEENLNSKHGADAGFTNACSILMQIGRGVSKNIGSDSRSNSTQVTLNEGNTVSQASKACGEGNGDGHGGTGDTRSGIVSQCPYCPAQFTHRYRVRRHIKSVHGSERPYKCQYEDCDKAYKAVGDLNRHIRFVHKKERPCVCVKCGAVFTRPHSLEAHHLSKNACYPRNSVLEDSRRAPRTILPAPGPLH